jgi:negative modulator of initiation of replication
MKTIQIDNDIYEHLLRNVRTLGEDASSILRRLLGIKIQTHSVVPNAPTTIQSPSSVDDCIQNPRFQMEREAVGKFLFALSWLNKKHEEQFKGVLQLRGRSRQYFAQSADALEQTGNSVNPQRIPDSHYWVITNNDTPKKQRMLLDVMRLLGYPMSDAVRLADALE